MKSKTITLDEIKRVISSLDLISAIEQGFIDYSSGRATVPPIGELLMDKGEVHIKYGYIQGDDYYVIKIASAFYDNPKIGLPSSNGMMLLFNQHTGETECILLDEGYLTDTRTAIAGAIAAKYLAPENVERIGMVGTGTQARMQLQYLKKVVDCSDVLVWGRGKEKLSKYKTDMKQHGFDIETTTDISGILKNCNLIVAATPAHEPLLRATDLQSGVHITAMGSDTPEKQELESGILEQADLVVTDSIEQCMERGEIYKAIKTGSITKEKVVELGNNIAGKAEGRTSDDQITVADLTGVAVQDIKIAEAVFEN